MLIDERERLDRIRGRIMIAREFIEAGRTKTAMLRAIDLAIQELNKAGCSYSHVERFRDAMAADR